MLGVFVVLGCVWERESEILSLGYIYEREEVVIFAEGRVVEVICILFYV